MTFFGWFGSFLEDFAFIDENCLVWDIARVKASSVFNTSLVTVRLAYFEGRDEGRQPSKMAEFWQNFFSNKFPSRRCNLFGK